MFQSVLARRAASLTRGVRYFSTTSTTSATESVNKGGIVVGWFENENAIELTPAGRTLDEFTGGKISKSIKLSGKKGKSGENLMLFDLLDSLPRVAVVGVGKEKEIHSSGKGDVFRKLAGTGVKLLKANGARAIGVDCSHGYITESAEGAILGLHKYTELKKKKDGEDDNNNVAVEPFFSEFLGTQTNPEWEKGLILARAQNLARFLAERPSNMMTPTIFTEVVQDYLKSQENVTVHVRGLEWAEEQKMGCFIGVSKGSKEPLKFMETHYCHPECVGKPPLVLVGKGITFDSGGISIKPSANMGLMKGDMGGAAAVVSTIFALSSLKSKVNVIALTPLCENMPSGEAVKPGDVLRAANGTTVEVDNTDAEGRLVLADALVYAKTFSPHTIVDVATLTGAIEVALGTATIGAFTPSSDLWKEIDESAYETGEKIWRMPIFPEHKKQMESSIADLINAGSRGGGACTAAAFLKEFVTIDRWLHLDIASVMRTNEEGPYTPKGMSGKPVRTLVNLALKLGEKDFK